MTSSEERRHWSTHNIVAVMLVRRPNDHAHYLTSICLVFASTLEHFPSVIDDRFELCLVLFLGFLHLVLACIRQNGSGEDETHIGIATAQLWQRDRGTRDILEAIVSLSLWSQYVKRTILFASIELEDVPIGCWFQYSTVSRDIGQTHPALNVFGSRTNCCSTSRGSRRRASVVQLSFLLLIAPKTHVSMRRQMTVVSRIDNNRRQFFVRLWLLILQKHAVETTSGSVRILC